MSEQDIEYSQDKTPAENVAALVSVAYGIEVKTPADMTAAELREQLEVRDKLVTCLRAEVKCQVEAYNRLHEAYKRLANKNTGSKREAVEQQLKTCADMHEIILKLQAGVITLFGKEIRISAAKVDELTRQKREYEDLNRLRRAVEENDRTLRLLMQTKNACADEHADLKREAVEQDERHSELGDGRTVAEDEAVRDGARGEQASEQGGPGAGHGCGQPCPAPGHGCPQSTPL